MAISASKLAKQKGKFQKKKSTKVSFGLGLEREREESEGGSQQRSTLGSGGTTNGGEDGKRRGAARGD